MLLSLDASTKSTGWAIFDGQKLVDYGCITSASSDVLKRIFVMQDGIDRVISQYPIERIVMEEVRPDTISGNIHTQKMLTYLQAAVEFLIYQKHKHIVIEYIYPSSWRAKCGIKTGRGVKREELKIADIEFVKSHYNISANDDEADSIGIGHSCTHDSKVKPDFNWK